MKNTLWVVLVLLCAGRATGAEKADAQTVGSDIRDVAVYADRARVTRVAKVRLVKGTTTFSFAKLPGWTDEESVRATLPAESGARIVDVRTERDYLAGAGDENLKAAESALQLIADQIAALDDEQKVLDARTKQVESIRAFSLEKLPRDAAVREIKVDDYRAVVDFVTETLREISTRRRETTRQRRELEPELAARQKKLAEVKRTTQLEQTTILVVVGADVERETELSLTYMLPGATWIAAHELRANDAEPDKVSLTSYAVVTQTTGEDWRAAALSFSTQSPSEAIRIPELDALLLGDRHAIARMAAKQTQSSFQRARSAFEGQNVLWFNYNNPGENVETYKGNWAQQRDTQGRASDVFARLRERGTTAHFRGKETPTVRSDGRSIRVPIGAVELSAARRLVAAPEISLNVARTVELTNTGALPLLPGRTSLFSDGAFLGVTDLDFVASGESFSVLLGVEDRIKLSRVLDRANSSLERGRRTRMKVAFDIGVENLSDTPASVDLTDRIPVSQNKDIRVYRVDIEPEVDPDLKGLVRWDVTLAPGETRELRVEYTVEYPPEVIQTMKQSRLPMGDASVAPAEQMDIDLSSQIEALEARF